MNTTISISKELKEKIAKLGDAGESYEDVIRKMYEMTRRNLLINYLYDTSNTISAKEALRQAKKKWPKSLSQNR